MMFAQRTLARVPSWFHSLINLNGHAIRQRASSRLLQSAIYCSADDIGAETKLPPPPKPRQVTKGRFFTIFHSVTAALPKSFNLNAIQVML